MRIALLISILALLPVVQVYRHSDAKLTGNGTVTKQRASVQPSTTPTASSTPTPLKVMDSEQDEGRGHKDWWDKSYVIFTGLIFVVGAIGTLFAVQTLRSIRRQTDALITAERSWVVGYPEIWSPEIRAQWEPGDPQASIEEMRGWVHLFSARLKNVGKSPAQIDCVAVHYKYLTEVCTLRSR
jgi:hypothetical protein